LSHFVKSIFSALGKEAEWWQTASSGVKETDMRLSALILAGVALTSASFILAKEGKAPQKALPPALVSTLTACRAITDSAARLACFDDASAKLDAAYQANEIYIADKSQVRDTRRKLFGLPIPNLGIFGAGDDPASADTNQVNEVETSVKQATSNADGWRIVTAEDSIWQQTDSSSLGLSPKPGMKVVIRKSALGSFKMNIAGMPAIKVKRLL
jgi:hypothetical protein